MVRFWMRRVVALLVPFLCLQSGEMAEADWHAAKGPLATRWAADVSPTRVHPEYPRPQMVRPEWINLNGLWDYAITGRGDFAPTHYEGKILVPFPVESALSGVMKAIRPDQRIWYRRTFQVPRTFKGKRVLLHFGAVDWEATVIVNGHEAGVHRGGYDGFTYDITPALAPNGPQELIVSVWDPTDAGPQPRGKQTLKPGGIYYTPTSGIWQTVWLEAVPASSIADLQITPDVDHSSVEVTATVRGSAQGIGVDVEVSAGGRPIAQAHGLAGRPVRVAIPHPQLWSPDHPFLYDLRVSLKRAGKTVDAVTSYFGMRKIALGKDARGITRPMLNGHFVFQIGPLDQGFWPDGLYTAPTDAALRYDLEVMKQLGFNMVRKHVKVEPERWYYWCDKLGLLVWQDMPSGNNDTPDAKHQFELELQRMILSHRNHPCIVQWVVFNEGWGQYDTERLTDWVKRLDPTRLVDDASGWTDKGVGDVHDMHNYPGPGSPHPEAHRAAVLGEFGGLGLKIDGHTWENKTWGYQGMSDRDALTRRYVRLLRGVYRLKDDPGLSGAVYTQITDVETEGNGLMTYDRAVLKVDAAAVSAANRGKFPPEAQLAVLVPSSKDAAQIWRYTFQEPPANWYQPDFDDAGWKEGPGGFGTLGTPGAVVRTQWNSSDIWLRRTFTVTAPLPAHVELLIHHDEDAEVYLNGVRISHLGGYTTDYEEVDLEADARRALKPGTNVLAVHCHQTAGGQYIDVGLLASE
ncbi:MAG: glycoside hydrolase family 2 protein [Chthonomonadales bacterium]